jgi:hypothetical protein
MLSPLKKEEKYTVLYINNFPFFPRRGVMPERS